MPDRASQFHPRSLMALAGIPALLVAAFIA
jgi:hypothetical protein